jgi:hypothetical protein
MRLRTPSVAFIRSGVFMQRFIGTAWGAVFLLGLVCGVRMLAADDKDAKAILDKAIKALGGEEKLSTVKACHSKSKRKIGDMDFTIESTVQGLDHRRQVFEGEINCTKVKGEKVLAGDKGFEQFWEDKTEFDKDAVANEKRSIYLQVLPMTLLPLRDKEYRVETVGEEKVGGKPAVGLKVTPPDKKEFTIYFDKESGLPVKMVAKVVGWEDHDEFVRETIFADYKEFDGITKATRIESYHGGRKIGEEQITEFKVLDKVDPKTFDVSK